MSTGECPAAPIARWHTSRHPTSAGFILRELGYRLPLGFVLGVQAAVLHAALWTGIPAGGGGGDLALAAAFATWVPRAAAATALVLWRYATLFCPLTLGAAGFIALASRSRGMQAPTE